MKILTKEEYAQLKGVLWALRKRHENLEPEEQALPEPAAEDAVAPIAGLPKAPGAPASLDEAVTGTRATNLRNSTQMCAGRPSALLDPGSRRLASDGLESYAAGRV